MKKILGVIGGLGPLATAYFFEIVTKLTDVRCDQDHLEILIHSVPQTPDRTAYILGESTESPLPKMTEAGLGLVRNGAEVIAIPCITAHYFHDDLEEALGVKVMHLPRETAAYLAEAGKKRVGIMATDGTVRSGLFQKELEEAGLTAITPDPERQADVMHLIYRNIKLGKAPEMDRFEAVRESLQEAGAEVIILGCTELSLIKRDQEIGHGFIDGMDVLAMRTIEACGAKVKLPFGGLIT